MNLRDENTNWGILHVLYTTVLPMKNEVTRVTQWGAAGRKKWDEMSFVRL